MKRLYCTVIHSLCVPVCNSTLLMNPRDVIDVPEETTRSAKAFNTRLKAFHIINAPSCAEVLIAIIKSVFSSKLSSRKWEELGMYTKHWFLLPLKVGWLRPSTVFFGVLFWSTVLLAATLTRPPSGSRSSTVSPANSWIPQCRRVCPSGRLHSYHVSSPAPFHPISECDHSSTPLRRRTSSFLILSFRLILSNFLSILLWYLPNFNACFLAYSHAFFAQIVLHLFQSFPGSGKQNHIISEAKIGQFSSVDRYALLATPRQTGKQSVNLSTWTESTNVHDNKVLFAYTDAAAFMVAAMALLRVFYPFMLHMTCLTQSMNNVVEQVKLTLTLCLIFIVNEPLLTLSDLWLKKLDSYHDWFLQHENFKSDESKRQGGDFNFGDLFGFEGSFRKLNVD
ncbi:hypothetical protein ANN_26715 [Periplaneta americana]|uniref:Uncharacterized protein n=1 Tax=Periplaneta americana TaxID=6978 RepID=A0ABQ8RZ03_PERAM|nr:hypothetical protein ANN_26715 [Periplaneta americana]